MNALASTPPADEPAAPTDGTLAPSPATTATLQFDGPRVVQAILGGGDPALVRQLEDSLGVRLTTREGWIRLEGSGASVAQARRMLEQLDRARQGGTSIRRWEFLYALRQSALPDGSGHDLAALGEIKIITSPRRPAVTPKTPNQLAYLRAIEAHDIVFGLGPAGTGKTFLAVATAVQALRREQVGRIVLTRPAVEAGEALGFLPGDLQEKIFPYLRPLYDALQRLLEPDELQRYLEKKSVEVAPLAYMRGRTLDNAFIILDEAQNTTQEQMFMFLTRLGQGAKCVITGDRTQIDLPPNRRSGLVEAVQALKDTAGIAFTHLDEADVVRHELVQSIIRAYRLHRYGDGAPPRDGRDRRAAD